MHMSEAHMNTLRSWTALKISKQQELFTTEPVTFLLNIITYLQLTNAWDQDPNTKPRERRGNDLNDSNYHSFLSCGIDLTTKTQLSCSQIHISYPCSHPVPVPELFSLRKQQSVDNVQIY